MAVDTHSFDESNGASLVITAIIFLVLTWISVTLRTYVRAFMTNGIQVDDWLMLVSQVSAERSREIISWTSFVPDISVPLGKLHSFMRFHTCRCSRWAWTPQ